MTLIVPNNRLAAYEATFASNMRALNLKPQTRFMTLFLVGLIAQRLHVAIVMLVTAKTIRLLSLTTIFVGRH